MKRRERSIVEYTSHTGTQIIIIENARHQPHVFEHITKMLKEFLHDEEVFFGFHRLDGMNLTISQRKSLKKEIPLSFLENGEMQSLNQHVTIAKKKMNDHLYHLLPEIFDYYLETTLFSPKIDWGEFKEYYCNYQKHRFEEIITHRFADIIFIYSDSSDFVICFNPKKYNPGEVRNTIDNIFNF